MYIQVIANLFGARYLYGNPEINRNEQIYRNNWELVSCCFVISLHRTLQAEIQKATNVSHSTQITISCGIVYMASSSLQCKR